MTNQRFFNKTKWNSNEGRITANSSSDEYYKSDLQINEKVNVNLQPKEQAAVAGENRQKITKE